MRNGWLVVVLGIATGVASARAAPARTVGVLPLRARWATAADQTLVVEALTDVGGELGLEVVRLDADAGACWSDNSCYARVAKTTGTARVLAVEVVRTSSGRPHVTFRLVDTATDEVRTFELVRSLPGVLRAQLRPTITAIRDAIPEPPVAILPTPTPTIPPVPPPPIPPAPAPETPAPLAWYQAISVNAFASASYTYNFARPPGGNNALRVFDLLHDSATIDVAELVIQRPVVGRNTAGFRIDFAAGASIPRVTASAGLFRDAAGNAADFDLQQAYASYVAPLKRGLRIDVGKFVTGGRRGDRWLRRLRR